jgi:hypothetical protein
LQLAGTVDGLHPVAGLADDLEIGLLGEHELEPAPKERVVIDDENADRSFFARRRK